MTTKIFSATVNGKRRRCHVELSRIHASDVDEAELTMSNDEASYKEFYRGATQADYDADLLDRKLSKA